MASVSHSEADTYLSCRRKHYYGYGLSLQRLTTSDALATGTAGHAILERFYKVILEAGSTKKLQLAAFDRAEEAAVELYEELNARGEIRTPYQRTPLAEILFDWYFPNEQLVKAGYLIQAVEMEFNLLYDEENDLRYPFVVDLIAVDPRGDTVVVDHKFVYDFYNDAAADFQSQIPKYIGAMRALNYKVSHGIYNMLRTRVIKVPRVEQMTLALPVKPNPVRVQRTFMEQIGVANEIQALKLVDLEEWSKKAFRVNNNLVCRSCSFRDICLSELNGGNTKLMMQSEYKIRERKQFKEVSKEKKA